MAQYERSAIRIWTSLGFLNFGQALIFYSGMTVIAVMAVVEVMAGRLTLGDFVLLNTFLLAFGALAVSFGLSITFAWLIERTDLPIRNLLFVVIVASIGMPNVIVGIAYAILLNPVNGLVNSFLHAITGTEGSGPLNVYTLPERIIFVERPLEA